MEDINNQNSDMKNRTDELLLSKDVAYLRKDVEKILSEVGKINDNFDKKIENLKSEFVSKTEFWPVRTLVYGFTGVILLTVIGALVALVINVTK